MFDIEPYLWSGIAVATGLFVVMAFILHHHWTYYGIDARSRASAEALFLFGGILLMIGAAGCAFAFKFLS